SHGARVIQLMASSNDAVWISQKPATRSSLRLNGPRLTRPSPPEYLMRAPFAVGCSPSPACITPALHISSLNLPMAVNNSVLGITPASVSLLPFTITMNRMVVSLWSGRPFAGTVCIAHQEDEPAFATPTCALNLFRGPFARAFHGDCLTNAPFW